MLHLKECLGDDIESVEELQLMSKTALKSIYNFDRYLNELDYNFKVLRDASVKHQDNAALERYEKSVQKEPEPLSIGKYVLKITTLTPFSREAENEVYRSV